MLPKNLKYQNKIESASGTVAYTSHIQPQNSGPYSDGQTILINVPTRNNLTLISSESVLKFTLAVKPAAAAEYVRLDRGGASCCIQRLRLYSGSNLIEDIDNYGLLFSDLISLQANSASHGKLNITHGVRLENIVTGNFKVTAGAPTNDLGGLIAQTHSLNVRSYMAPAGERLLGVVDNEIGNVPTTGTVPRTYCVSLLSILGTLSNQYVPLFAMSSSPLRLELQLCSNANQFCCSNVALSSFSVSNVEYIASMLELSDQSMEIINNSLMGQPLQYAIPSFRNYVNTNTILNNVSTQLNVPVAAKFSSLKSLFANIRKTANVGAVTFFPHSSCHYGLKSYNLRIGSKIVPAKAPESISEFFIEACKAIGSVSDINHCPNLNMYSYNVKVDTANTETDDFFSASSVSKSFILGVDLEVFANAEKDSIYSGYNSLNDDIFCQMQFNDNITADTPVRIDFYALYDSLLVCENGVAMVKF